MTKAEFDERVVQSLTTLHSVSYSLLMNPHLIGVYRLGIAYPGSEVVMPVQGWFGANLIKDGAGKEHMVDIAPNDSMVVPGDVTEADLAELVNLLGPDPDDTGEHAIKTLGYYCMITIVPQEGKPVTQLIELR